MGRRLIGSFNVSAAGAAPMHTVEEKERERRRMGEWKRDGRPLLLMMKVRQIVF